MPRIDSEVPHSSLLWLHNHNVLAPAYVCSLMLGFFLLILGQVVLAGVLLLLAIGVRLFSHLLCGWVHTFAAFESHKMRAFYRERIQ